MGGATKRSFISAYFLLSAYFLTARSYKRMRLTTRVYGICFGRIMHMAFPVLEPYNKMDIVAKLYISFSFTACACVGPLVRQLSMHIFNL